MCPRREAYVYGPDLASHYCSDVYEHYYDPASKPVDEDCSGKSHSTSAQ
jgi:hypothetical protein